MNKARFNELPPMVRQEIKTLRSWINTCKMMADQNGLKEFRAQLKGYTQGLADAGMITDAEHTDLCKEV